MPTPATGGDPLWVPAEHRLAGLDRRTIAPALAVLVLAFFLSVVLPAIDGAVAYDDRTEPGDVLDLAEGRLTMAAAPGWNLEQGVRVGRTRGGTIDRSTTVLSAGGVRMNVQVAPFGGTPEALLERVDALNDAFDDERGLGAATERYTVRTDAGAVGVAEGFSGLSRQGTLATFVIPVPREPGSTRAPVRTGVSVLVVGSDSASSARRGDIDGMLRSIRAGASS